MKNKIIMFIFASGYLLLLSPFLWSDGIEVISSGTETVARQTEVVLTVAGDEQVKIYQLPSASSPFSLGADGTTKALCVAPATLSVPGGASYLFVSDSSFYGKRFQIKATGGTQTWKVRNPRPWEFIVGTTLVGIGAIGYGTFIVGAIVDTQTVYKDQAVIAISAASAGAALLGLLLGMDAGAKADLVKIEE